MITSEQIRQSFLDYFARQGHRVVPSSPLVPKEDPTLLFTNAGMVQFKKVFQGQESLSCSRAVTSQKCLRVGGKHNDLENVGRTRRHHTFFEMLGNFSFGDYFKEGAIRMAWEYLTRELELSPDKLFVSIFREDDEAEELWRKIVGMPREKIYRLDEEENFWSMGDVGPCGPCSEVLFDQGEQMACGPDCEIGVCDCDRYLEIWNLVFMQYNRDESGNLHPLPHPNIDTGMGLERIAAICQGVESNFDTDLFRGLIQSAAERAGAEYKQSREVDTALRVIADHTRAIAFMIADGILPSNEGRGYVLRRLIRRGFRFGRSIGLNEPFLCHMCDQLVEEMGEVYRELAQNRDFMSKVVHKEEEGFSKTLDHGLEMLEEKLSSLAARGDNLVPGEFLFKLYDTYGFPVDIVKDVAESRGFSVDEEGYDREMQAQRERSKASWAGGSGGPGEIFTELFRFGAQSEFVGYETRQTSSRVVAILDNHGHLREQLSEGESGYVVTSRTPFYGESGGQVGDCGSIYTDSDRAEVQDALHPTSALLVHRVEVTQGSLKQDQEVHLAVSRDRLHTARNHTCTHLLHAALRKVVGDHVKQAGSLVAPDRLRFDFTHISPLSLEEIQAVEDEVNEAILRDLPLDTRVEDFSQAEREGVIGLFEEKYEDRVRIVEVPGVSKELCGGTHLERTGQAGSFYILSETGVSSGVRRVEAATGWNAVEQFRRQRDILDQAANELKTSPEEVSHKIASLQEQIKSLSREKEQLQAKQLFSGGGDLMDQAREVAGTRVLTARLELSDSSGIKGLRNVMDDLRSRFGSGVILLAAESKGKAHLLLYVSPDLHHRFTAPQLVQKVAGEVGGSGGGRNELAQAGGSDPHRLDSALQRLEELLQQMQ